MDGAIIASIPFAHFNFYANGTGVVAGWGGRNNNDPEGPRKLQKGSVQILTNSQCQDIYRRNGTKIQIKRTQICADGVNSDPCYGDSGGPLMCRRNGVYILCGIISNIGTCTRYEPPRICKYLIFNYFLSIKTFF